MNPHFFGSSHGCGGTVLTMTTTLRRSCQDPSLLWCLFACWSVVGDATCFQPSNLLGIRRTRGRRTPSTTTAILLSLPDTVTDMGESVNTLFQMTPMNTDLSSQEQLQLLQQSLSAVSQTWQELSTTAQVAVCASPLVPLGSWVYQCVRTAKDQPTENTYPESMAATYELSNAAFLWELPGDAASFVRPLLKQTQLEYRQLRVACDGNRDGYNSRIFHQKVDGQGAAIVLCKAGQSWFGGYNPRGWASLGGSRPSRASFLFYQKSGLPLTGVGGGTWQKLRVLGGGGMSCGNDLFDSGIYMGAEGLVVPLDGSRTVKSRLGTYFETGPQDRGTLLPRAGIDTRLQELKVLVGVYDKSEDIPNSGGVLDLGLY